MAVVVKTARKVFEKLVIPSNSFSFAKTKLNYALQLKKIEMARKLFLNFKFKCQFPNGIKELPNNLVFSTFLKLKL